MWMTERSMWLRNTENQNKIWEVCKKKKLLRMGKCSQIIKTDLLPKVGAEILTRRILSFSTLVDGFEKLSRVGNTVK